MLRFLVSLATLFIFVFFAAPSFTAEPPNVLFLAVDDMKDWVGCLGGYEGTVHTPNIDRLAASGVLFTNAHCASPKCAPSRVAIMTGLRPSTTGLYENGHWWRPNSPKMVTLPMYFRQNGYHVAGAGKIYHHTAGNNPPEQWDAFQRLLFCDDPWFRGNKLCYPWSKSGAMPEEFPFSGVKGLGHENDWGSLDLQESEYDDSRSADYAVQFLQNSKIKQPFFLACGLFRPHLPWYVPPKYFAMYPLEKVVLPKVLRDDRDDLPPAALPFAKSREQDFRRITDQKKWKEAVQAYLASITYADAQLGLVLDALAASPHAKNTVVLLWSDHGWHLGEKGHWHKSTLWEEATRVPFIIRAPAIKPGVCTEPVTLLNIFPTLNELCGLPQKKLDGVSLVPLLHNPQAEWLRPAVIEFRRGNAAVRTKDFRYIRYANGDEELYDHRSDPQEWHNLASKKKFAGVKEELAKSLPKKWADSARTKSAFRFNPANYSWTNKKTGETIK